MSVHRLLPLLGLVGCVRDPTFFGYWDLEAVERDGVLQEEVGFLEILSDAQMALFLRYDWSDGAFAPDPQPAMQFGETDVVAQEIFGNYKSKGEIWNVTFDLFGTTFRVETYVADAAELAAPEALWPGGTEGLPTTLFLRR
jgi:hypothetical protein